MDAWFHQVDKLYEKTDLTSLPTNELQHYIWNCDETGFCTSAAVSKILAKRGDKDVQVTMGGSGRDYITVLACGCADGTHLPPYVVYKGKNLWSRWMKGGPSACLYSVSDSGWMESANFLQWFEKQFVPAVQHLCSKFPVILFFDGHHSHMSLALIEMARANSIHLVCFPPHCTHNHPAIGCVSIWSCKSCMEECSKDAPTGDMCCYCNKRGFPHAIGQAFRKIFFTTALH